MERVNPYFHMEPDDAATGIDTSPYGNGVSPSIPVSIWGSKWNGYAFLWGSPYRNRSPFPNWDGSVTNPFPNRVRCHLGIEVKITIWECFPYGDHHFHMVITVRKWAGRLEYFHMGNPRFRIELVSIWGLTYTSCHSFCWSSLGHQLSKQFACM
jgi:hypothetical protein